MIVVYTSSTVEDLRWLKTYYNSVFPEGAGKARSQIKRAEDLLKQNPLIGVVFEGSVRALHIQRTPFTVLYRVTPSSIEILRVWDARRDPGAMPRF